jgi:transcriptional regulator with XRE-family HTH domain
MSLVNRSNRVLVVAPPPKEVADRRRHELREFLKVRREALQPEDVDLPRGERRLVKGLRREEVATLAGVGLSWYTWLEQGREINVSENALSRIATALRLSDADRTYLFSLAGLAKQNRSELAATLPPELVGVIDGYRWPAAVLSPVFDLIHANRLASFIYGVHEAVEPFPENQIWQTLKNPRRHSLLVDYGQEARHFVSLFRLISAAHVGEERFERLVEHFRAESELFREVWASGLSDPPTPRSIRLRHPDIGEASVRVVRLPLTHDGVGIAFFLNPENAETAEAFNNLRARLENSIP